MTNELEKQFFSTFGIEPEEAIFCGYNGACPFDYPCDKCFYFLNNKGSYPQITDRILLELICIQNKFSHPYSFYGETLEFLKDDILRLFIEIEEFFRENELTEYESFKSQVKALIEEG